MKSYLLILIPLTMLVGCENYKQEAEVLQKEKSDLEYAAAHKDSAISSFLVTFNEIEANLREIDERKEYLENNSSPTEMKTSQSDRIKENIAAINELVKSNKEKIAQLTKQLKNSKSKIVGFEKMLASLNEQMGVKDEQLASLNVELTAMHSKVEVLNTDIMTLTEDNMQKQGKIEEQTLAIHKAYIVKGTSKELQQKQVIVKEGGFLGIGKEERLKEVVNRDAFESIDVTQTSVIPINAKNVELLTYHAADSYSIEHKGKEVSDLVITDPDKFWAGSKYLVVMLDK